MEISIHNKTEVFLSDLHLPCIHQEAYALAEKIIKDVNPHIIFLGGDIVDLASVSSWLHNPKEVSLRRELHNSRQWLYRLRDTFSRKTIYYLRGNHEDRIMHYIWKHAPELSDIDELSITKLLNLDQMKIQYLKQPIRIGKLWHFHGDETHLYNNAVNVALNVFRRLLNNVIMGHWHNCQAYYHRGVDRKTRGSWVNPCLCNSNDLAYDRFANW